MKKGKIIALILAAALVTGAFPMYSFADETEDTEVAAEETIEETIEETQPIESEEEDDEDIVYEEVEDVEETEISVETEEPTESTPTESTPAETDPSEDDENVIVQGNFSDTVSYVLTDDGVLSVSGEGAVPSYVAYAANLLGMQYAGNVNTIKVEEGITRLSEAAFQGFSNVVTVYLPDSLIAIDQRAFMQCTKLTDIVIPSNCTTLGDGVFQDCKSLESIAIPDGVTRIAGDFFRGCSNLKNVSIPNSVAEISNYAFCDCESLCDISLLSVKTFGGGAFYNCTGLESVDLSSVVSFSNITENNGNTIGAFSGCSELKTVALGSDVSKIVPYTFSDCTSLEEVHFYTNRNKIEFRGGTFDGANESCKIYFHSPEGYIFDTTGSVVAQTGRTIPMIATFSEGNTVVTYSSALMHVDTTSTFTITNKLITLSADLKGYRIKLNDYIGFVFYMDIQDSDGAYVSIDIPGMDTQIQDVTADRKSSDGYYEFTCEVPARQMADDIRVQVHFSDGTLGKAYTVSVRAYCMSIINDNQNRYAEYVPLAKALLNYGSAAQTYFGYNCSSESDLANGKMDYKDREMGIPVVDTNMYSYDTTIPADSPINFAGVSLTFGSRSTMRLYFSGVSVNEVYCDSPDASIDMSADNNYVIVTVPVTKLKDFLHDYKVSFYSADSSTYITYRPYNYVVNILNNSTNFETPMYDLVRGYYYYIEEIDKLSKLDS